jgi:hypothetical protein
MKVPDLYVGKRLVVGEGFPTVLGVGLNEIRGSSFIEGPLIIGNATIPVIPSALIVAQQTNRDVKTPSYWSAYFQGSVRIQGKLIADVVASTTSKPFVINHPTKPNKKLVHVALEGPENGVYVRGEIYNENVIELPDYWTNLVDEETITVNLQPIKHSQNLIVEKIENNKIFIKNVTRETINCFYHVYGTRKDIEKLKVEVEADEYGL